MRLNWAQGHGSVPFASAHKKNWRIKVTNYTNGLTAGQQLLVGDTLTSYNGDYQLILQTDGNLVLYTNNSAHTALWATGTNGKPSQCALMQTDGNFVVYNATGTTSSSNALWASGTDNNSGAAIYCQNDGNLVIYAANGQAIWASNTWQSASASPGYTGNLTSGQQLVVGGTLTSSGGSYRLVLQYDGNLVLYQLNPWAALWATGTYGQPSQQAVLQSSDGNFVVYNILSTDTTSADALWASNTAGNPGDYLSCQDDGNLVIYTSGGSPIWATNTVQSSSSSSGSSRVTQTVSVQTAVTVSTEVQTAETTTTAAAEAEVAAAAVAVIVLT